MERPLERPPTGASQQERSQTEFTTKGSAIYVDPNEPRGGGATMYDPRARPPPPIGAGLFEAGAIWIPAAMSALQDWSLRNNVAHQMLSHWSELEGWRRADPNVWIIASVTLSEWDYPDEAGNVLRQVLDVSFLPRATRCS